MKTLLKKKKSTILSTAYLITILGITVIATSCENTDSINPQNKNNTQSSNTTKITKKAFMDGQPPKNGNSGGGG